MSILRSFLVAAALSAVGVQAVADIIENFNRPGSTVTVEQPQALMQRVRSVESTGEAEVTDTEDEAAPAVQASPRRKTVGYRVQVYADNNARMAKGEARNRERAVGNMFPAYATYVNYAAPYWRLRVGDFRNQGDAEKAAAEIRGAFPRYAKEVRVVRDRVNVR